ncbi:MAG: GAF domain-containing protein, partial [Oceanisphaera sp.]|nr:GAF domain-containing protein [Oceanisphaera sp.]
RILTNPYVFYTTGEIGISLASQSATGAILAVDASVEDLSLQVDTLSPVPGTQLALVSEGNRVIGYEHVEQMVLPDINNSLRLALLSELNLPALNEVADSVQPAGTLFPVSMGDEPGFGLWSPLSTFANENLRVLMAVPEASLLADAKALLRKQVGLSLLLVIAFLPIGWWLGSRIGKPLHELAGQVEAIGRFEFDADIKGVHSNIREVHDLGLHTERMAGMITNFSRISQTLNRSTDLDNMISEVLHELASAVGATDAVVYLNNTEQTRLIRAGHVGPTRVPVTLTMAEDPLAAVTETLAREDQRLTTTRLINRSNHPIGVLAINRPEQTIISDVEFERFMERMAGSVAIAIETRRLFKEQKALFDGIIRLLADAIDTKSP